MPRSERSHAACLLAASIAAVLATALCSTIAAAQEKQADPPSANAPPPATSTQTANPEPAPAVTPSPADDTKRRLDELERQNAKLRDELEQLKEDHAFVEKRVEQLMPVKDKITGYLDFGFFYVQGNGSGIRNDTGFDHFPEYRGVVPEQWVFMGDPLSTAINSRGEPPALGGSRAITFDPIKNGGQPSFIMNSLNLSLLHGIGTTVTLNAAVDFVPRGRNPSDSSQVGLGDYIDAKLGYAEWKPTATEQYGLALSAGKFDSVLGIEYRNQDAPDRMGVAPSLICRYTCGRPLGLKARAKFLDERLIAALSITNGSNFVEMFPFYDEIDHNAIKTVSGRVSYRIPIAGQGIEVGTSGAYGAQDLQTDNSVSQWHFGFDARVDYKDLDVRAEFVQGKAQGKTDDSGGNIAPCNVAPCLKYKGAYGLVGYRLFNWLTPYSRVDWRDALHQSGASFVYISQLMRVTAGLRFEIGTNVIVKTEYTLIQELGRVPNFPDDVFTSSMVVKF